MRKSKKLSKQSDFSGILSQEEFDAFIKAHSNYPFDQPNLATAQWGDLKPLNAKQNAKGVFYLGNEDPENTTSLGVCNDHHILCVGGTRSAKGVSVIIPNLLLWDGSAMAIDPKGELATVTARRRGKGSKFSKGMGQKVYVIDPFLTAGRPDDRLQDIQAQFNPLAGLDPDDPFIIDLINEIVTSFIQPNKNGEVTYWRMAGRSLLKVTILHVMSSDEYDEESKNLVTVYKLLCCGDREKKEFLEEIGADDIPLAHSLLFKAMAANPAFGGLIASVGETYCDMLTQAPKQYLGVIETLKTSLEFMDSPGIQECLMGSDFSLDDLKNDPDGVTVYLCLPLSLLETHFRWLRVIISQELNTFERQKYQPKSGAPVLMVLDEFAALKKMPALQNGIAQMAGHGVKFLLAVQDLNQIKSAYGEAWETFVANCGVKLFLSNEDHFTRDYASKLVGETQIRVKNYSANATFTENHMEGYNSSSSFGGTHNIAHTNGASTNSGASAGIGLLAYNHSWNRGGTKSVARSDGFTSNVTEGYSTSTTRGYSQTVGVQINWQTRPLVRPDEVGRLFAYRQNTDGLPYAGNTLVLMAGEQAMSVKRTLYYRHKKFEGLFDPHLDHPVQPPYAKPLDVAVQVPDMPRRQPVMIDHKPEAKANPHWLRRIASWLWQALKTSFWQRQNGGSETS